MTSGRLRCPFLLISLAGHQSNDENLIVTFIMIMIWRLADDNANND